VTRAHAPRPQVSDADFEALMSRVLGGKVLKGGGDEMVEYLAFLQYFKRAEIAETQVREHL
jgi:hypothetical protein